MAVNVLISPGHKLQMWLGSGTDVLTVGALELIQFHKR